MEGVLLLLPQTEGYGSGWRCGQYFHRREGPPHLAEGAGGQREAVSEASTFLSWVIPSVNTAVLTKAIALVVLKEWSLQYTPYLLESCDWGYTHVYSGCRHGMGVAYRITLYTMQSHTQ